MFAGPARGQGRGQEAADGASSHAPEEGRPAPTGSPTADYSPGPAACAPNGRCPEAHSASTHLSPIFCLSVCPSARDRHNTQAAPEGGGGAQSDARLGSSQGMDLDTFQLNAQGQAPPLPPLLSLELAPLSIAYKSAPLLTCASSPQPSLWRQAGDGPLTAAGLRWAPPMRGPHNV